MNCPPHVADPEQTVPQQYIVTLTKGETCTSVFHIEKTCRICKLPVIILTEKVNEIITAEGWEIIVDEVPRD